MSRTVWVKAALLAVLVAAAFVAARSGALPDVELLREQVRATGAVGWLVFVAGYALLVLFPTPASVLTIAGGALFGLWHGTLLVLLGALGGSMAAFEIGRLLGRDAVQRITRGRLARVDGLLSRHGLASVVAVRLFPVLPFVALNYAAGLSTVGRRDYFWGSALGMTPGVMAYAAVGAYGSDPLGLVVACSALLLLVLGGGAFGRRILARTSPEVRGAGESPGSRHGQGGSV